MITKLLIVALIIAVVVLAWRLLNRHWSREVYIRRDYEKYKSLDEQVTAGAIDVEPATRREHADRAIN